MGNIRTAILGYGRSGSTMHAGAIADNSNAFELVAVCDVDPARQREAAERFGCAVYDDYHRMLASEQLDLVSVITRSSQHCQMACDVLDAGVNVLVTKPWATNEAEARRMIAAAEASGMQLLPWLPARWGCDLTRLRALIAAGTIGNVFLVRRAVCSFGTRNDWQTERRHGGGYLLNWGPHIVDTAIQVIGSPVRSVYGRLRQTINPGDVEDIFLGVMTLANGVIVQAEYTIALEDLPAWFIQGDRGTIVVRGQQMTIFQDTPVQPDDPTQYATMTTDNRQVSEETLVGNSYGDEREVYADIARALRSEQAFPVPPAHALALTRVLDAIRLSDAEDRLVTL